MIARLEVTRGPLTEYPLAEKISGGWQNGVTFYPDEDVTKVTELVVRSAHDEQCEAEYVVGAACYSDCGCSDRTLETVKADTTTEWGVKYGPLWWEPRPVEPMPNRESCEQFIATPPFWANELHEQSAGIVQRQVTEWVPVETEGES